MSPQHFATKPNRPLFNTGLFFRVCMEILPMFAKDGMVVQGSIAHGLSAKMTLLDAMFTFSLHVDYFVKKT